jgi:hypothetical protein
VVQGTKEEPKGFPWFWAGVTALAAGGTGYYVWKMKKAQAGR